MISLSKTIKAITLTLSESNAKLLAGVRICRLAYNKPVWAGLAPASISAYIAYTYKDALPTLYALPPILLTVLIVSILSSHGRV